MQLLKNWKIVSKKLKGKSLIFLLDYDGTLTPIVKRGELANLSKTRKKTLIQLSNKYIIAIISGRSIKDIMKRVGIKGIFYAGNHGFEICGPSTKVIFGKAQRSAVRSIATELNDKTANMGGIIIEDKGITLSLHYRLAERKDYVKARKIFFKVIGPYLQKRKIRVLHGKKVLEVRPNISWDKGRVSLWLLDTFKKRYKLKRILPIYIGDDKTDEDAFKILKKKGLTIFVGKRKTLAEYTVKGVPQVYKFLDKFVR